MRKLHKLNISGSLTLILAVLVLAVSAAATPERRLAELEALVSSMQEELRMVKMQLDGTSLREQKIGDLMTEEN